MTETQKKLLAANDAAVPGTRAKVYSKLVVSKIRAILSIDDEFAILRQRDTKPEEFNAYNALIEQCKAEAREEVGIGGVDP